MSAAHGGRMMVEAAYHCGPSKCSRWRTLTLNAPLFSPTTATREANKPDSDSGVTFPLCIAIPIHTLRPKFDKPILAYGGLAHAFLCTKGGGNVGRRGGELRFCRNRDWRQDSWLCWQRRNNWGDDGRLQLPDWSC